MRIAKLVCLVVVAVAVASAQSTPAPPRISELNWTLGTWSYDGQFVSSGKKISADVSFETALDGKWILFRHDDRPPFQYHALAEWGWDAKAQEFVSTIQDSAGGVRVFPRETCRRKDHVTAARWERAMLVSDLSSKRRRRPSFAWGIRCCGMGRGRRSMRACAGRSRPLKFRRAQRWPKISPSEQVTKNSAESRGTATSRASLRETSRPIISWQFWRGPIYRALAQPGPRRKACR